ncbi:MAG TPA: hypothetical protein ENH10_08750 [Bacteroidetes bacterium]|nr:hypothetical protein BMS3Bbin04_01055 [bacterium BMS3Bbin04]HDO66099.1 hypothetical protein [Bacteroidota bacterium]HEX05224.1 hypothetical protein [Bacteroidota bacterium]
MNPPNEVSRSRVRWTVSIVFFSVVLLGMLTSCLWEPDRDNPADPYSDFHNDDGSLEIQVIDRADNPLEGAEVRLQGYGEARYTNTDGKATFIVPSELQYFTVTRDNYVSQSGEADVDPRATTTKLIKLNGKPSIDSVHVRTRMIDVDNGEQNVHQIGYEFDIYSDDPDGETDLTDILMYRPDGSPPRTEIASGYIRIEEDYATAISDFYELLGNDFLFVLYDEAEDTTQYTIQIRNMINYRGLTDNMAEGKTYDLDAIYLTWENLASEKLDVPAKTYRARIFSSQTISESIVDTTLTFENPEEDTLGINILQTEGLMGGFRYWWELYMFDKFGNYVQSERVYFDVDEIQGE